ncbi:hypothetical protein, partial [Bilophila wadsworthia]|uniref:hypothetical protein n=1 Tax=Bilophila wadsworthia TaxID=35833 RepID=UPI003AB8C997
LQYKALLKNREHFKARWDMLKFSALEDGYGSNCGASDTVARKGRRQRGNLSMNRWKVERFFA